MVLYHKTVWLPLLLQYPPICAILYTMRRALRPCPTRGCVNLIGRGQRLCPSCLRASRQRVDAARRPSSQRGYDVQWRKIRKQHLAENPFCAVCNNWASHVDHIVPLSYGGTNDSSNLQSLCRSCHSKKTAKHDGGFGNRKKIRKGKGR